MGTPVAENSGESAHTEALYREHGAAVERLCRSLLRDRSEAEDATQQVFLSAHRALLNGTVPREPLAWLLAVARNECFARFRRRAALPVPQGEALDEATADASVHALRAGELARLWEEVERMPAAQREAFLLREIRGLSYGQLADELSLSRPSVRSLLLRARTRLRRRLGDGAAVVGGAPWVQALLRLAGGGDGPSPLPPATKTAAVSLGALALAGSGATLPHVVFHDSTSPRHSATRHRVEAHVRSVASPATVAAASKEDRSSRDGSSAGQARRHDHSSRGGSNDSGTGKLMTVPVVQSTTSSEGHDGRGSSGSGDITTTTATTTTQSNSGEGSSTSGSHSDPDGGSTSVTTTTSSSGSDSGSGTTTDSHDGHGGG